MTDQTPAAGGLSTEERGGLLIALDCAVEGGTLTHDAAMRVLSIVDNHPTADREVARVTAAVEAWIDEAPEQTAGLDLLRQIIQPARTEAADRELARVTAAVEALAEEWGNWSERDHARARRGDNPVPAQEIRREAYCWSEASDALRAALSSAGTTACEGCACEAEHDGDYGSSGHAGPCPPHTHTTTLDDLLDRERAKAAAEALREAARELPGFDGIRTHGDAAHWLRDRAAAVSPEGGEGR